MRKLLYSSNIDFDMSDWQQENICEVFAGADCVMAVTEDGRTLQKVRRPEGAARTELWTHIRQIAVSGWAPGVALGLTDDGTCMIAHRPIRRVTEKPFDMICTKVEGWQNIVQVAASDALFALDAYGHVHYTSFFRYDTDNEYRSILR